MGTECLTECLTEWFIQCLIEWLTECSRARSVSKLLAFFVRDEFLVLFNDSGIKVRGAGTNVNHCVNQSECSIERLLERLLEWLIELFSQCFTDWLAGCSRGREREQHQHERQSS